MVIMFALFSMYAPLLYVAPLLLLQLCFFFYYLSLVDEMMTFIKTLRQRLRHSVVQASPMTVCCNPCSSTASLRWHHGFST